VVRLVEARLGRALWDKRIGQHYRFHMQAVGRIAGCRLPAPKTALKSCHFSPEAILDFLARFFGDVL
jgi:hypothetical protein